MKNNRLRDATSPYLLQHADHPVNWQPWDDAALAQAKAEDKPILLSIGYSACHWCHVMAHESFEDRETAELMNQLFINIKVDREERPDLDRIYQTAHQLLAQRPGGWPLTVFLTPDDQNPFFAGTYFPAHPRHGLPAFKGLLQSIATAFREQRSEISQQNLALQKAWSQLEPVSASSSPQPDAAPLDIARQQLAQSFDEANGGFGQAPKFPHPTGLNRLLRHWAATAIGGSPDPRALYAADFTLTRMARSGINDQLGGGFYRYSVDDQWMIPHFEKMLYDNGPLLALYTDIWQATGKPLFAATAAHTGDWVIREMQSSAGGYYSSLDADSEGAEGKFYLWAPNQVRQLLSDDEYRHFSRYHGLDRAANFEGSWHLHGCASIAELNQEFGSSAQLAESLLASGRRKLFQAREARARPARDEKILCSWNGLMIKAMARAGRCLDRPEFLLSAQRALAFLQREMWRDGRLLASHKDGRSSLAAYLDDYAFLLDAVLELLQARWRKQDLSFAIELASVLLAHFLDRERGGFYFTADDHERLIQRPKPFSDDATPAGNGVAAFGLARLGHLLGEQSYLDAALATLRAGWQQICHYPQAHCSLLDTLEEWLYPTETIVIRGSGEDLRHWQQRATRHYAPRRFSVAIPSAETNLPGLLASRTATGHTLAYICAGTRCEAPIDGFKAFDQRLTTGETRPQGTARSRFDGVTGSFRRPRE